jgi:type IV secretory pathway VirB10-like protein
VSSGDDVFAPKARRLGPRALAAIGAVLCLVVGGILVSVFRGSGAKERAPVSRENPERPNEPRFLEKDPGGGAERFTAEIEARQREQERRRARLRELLAEQSPPASPAASPLFMSGAEGGAYEDDPAALPDGGAEGGPPADAYRPHLAARPGRSFAAVPPAETRSQTALARALEAPVLLGAKDPPADPAFPGGRARFPLTPPSPPDFRSLLSQIQAGTSGNAASPDREERSAREVDFGRVVWAPAILLTALSSESPGPAEAWIEADARDRQGRVVLPQGSRVFGSYDTGAALGQKRLVVRWTAIELPTGEMVSLNGAESAGRDGAGGLRGKTDARIWGAFGRALFLSAVGAAAQLGQPQESATLGAAASNRQIAAASVANELARAAADVVRQATDIKPVIRVPAGSQFLVFVPADFDLR